MSETVSRGRMFRATVAVNDAVLDLMGRTPELAEGGIRAGAMYWHGQVLPEHFKSGAGQKYGYAPRAISYQKQKQGKPALVWSGSMRRDLTSAAQFKTAAGGSIELRMNARVLNLAPNMSQNNPDLYVKHKNGRGYPNTKREVKAITDEERQTIADVVTGHVVGKYERAQESEGGGRFDLTADLSQDFYPRKR